MYGNIYLVFGMNESMKEGRINLRLVGKFWIGKFDGIQCNFVYRVGYVDMAIIE